MPPPKPAPAPKRVARTLFVACLTCSLFPRRIASFTPSSISSARLHSAATSLLPSTASPSSPSPAPKPKAAYDLIVVGGGSAGLTAAKFAATFGKSVCLVEGSRVGGDCTWTGCVPSKTLLAAAKRAWTWRQMNEEYGGAEIDDASLRKMLRGAKDEVDEKRRRIYEQDDSPGVLRSLGIDLAEGRARFRDARTVDVKNDSDGTTRQIEAKSGIVVSTGATLRDPTFDIAGLDSVSYWTYENVWEEFFKSMEQNQLRPVMQTKVIVVGGGPIGCELSQAISRLGCSVTLIGRSPRLLPKEEEEASMALQRVLEEEGISVICNQKVASVTASESSSENIKVSLEDSSLDPIIGDHILVATGRVPNVQNMGLEDMGVIINSITKGIQVNKNLETSVKSVYAAGDCTGDQQFTHYAGYQGAIAARNILLPLKDPGVLAEVPSTTFTDPEVASFGLTERAARERYGEGLVSASFRPLAKIDRAVCEGKNRHGFIKIVYQSKTKQILGATIVAPVAGELVSELAVAKDAKLSLDRLSTVMHSYPSYSIALQQMAADVYYDKLKKNKSLYDVLKKAGL